MLRTRLFRYTSKIQEGYSLEHIVFFRDAAGQLAVLLVLLPICKIVARSLRLRLHDTAWKPQSLQLGRLTGT